MCVSLISYYNTTPIHPDRCKKSLVLIEKGMIFFTLINVTLFLMTFVAKQSPFFVDYVRATSILVFAGWFLVLIFYGYPKIVAFYTHFLQTKLPLPLVVSIDVACHVLPVIVLGLPTHPCALLCGVATILIWYIAVRNCIHLMYYLPKEHLIYRDMFVVVGSVAFVIIARVL